MRDLINGEKYICREKREIETVGERSLLGKAEQLKRACACVCNGCYEVRDKGKCRIGNERKLSLMKMTEGKAGSMCI